MVHHYRTWFPHIVIGLTILLGAGIYYWVTIQEDSAPPVPVANIPINAPLTQSEYEDQVTTIIEAYQADANRDGAFSSLLNMQGIPTEMRDLHVELILLLDQPSDSPANVNAGLNDLRNDYTWLP